MDNDEPTAVTLTVMVPPSLKRDIRIAAATSGAASLSDWVRDALTERLHKPTDDTASSGPGVRHDAQLTSSPCTPLDEEPISEDDEPWNLSDVLGRVPRLHADLATITAGDAPESDAAPDPA